MDRRRGQELGGVPDERAALIIAHPGHELRVHRWVEKMRPLSFVLTQGDGHTGASRIASTTNVLRTAGAQAGNVYGRLEDAQIYAALLRRDFGVFVQLLDELVDALIAQNISYAVCDAEEGYNPSHDVCHDLAIAATVMASHATDREMRAYDFPVVGAPDDCPADLRRSSIRL